MTASATYAIIQGGATGYTKAPIITTYAVFAVSLFMFVRVELRHPDPMLDLRLFRSASFSAVMGVAAISVFGLVGVALLSVLYMERVGQTSPLDVGVRLLPLFGTFLVVTVVAARVLVHRVGFTPLITAGLVLIGAGSLALLATDASGGYGAMWPGLLVAGIGAGLLTAPSTAAAVNSVPPQQEGMAAAAVNMARQLGTVLGPSVLGTVVTSRFPGTCMTVSSRQASPRRRRTESWRVRHTAAARQTSPHPSLAWWERRYRGRSPTPCTWATS